MEANIYMQEHVYVYTTLHYYDQWHNRHASSCEEVVVVGEHHGYLSSYMLSTSPASCTVLSQK